MRRTTQARGAVALSAVVALLAGGTAHADNFVANGDQVGLRENGKINFGEICANTTVTKKVPVALRRASSGDTFANSSVATFKVTALDNSNNRFSSATAVNGTIGTTTLPSGWVGAPAGTDSSQVELTVSFKAGAVGTQQAGSVTLQATGTKSTGGAATSGNQKFDVTTNKVIDCTPADTTKPELQLPGNLTAEATSASGAAVTYTATATDANPANPAVTCSTGSGATFPIGLTTVDCSATDAAGNTGTGSFTVSVADTKAPTFPTAPSDITAEATSGAGAAVTYTKPTAADAVGAGPVSCVPASGSTFALGTATVTCSSTDDANNKGTTSFKVTVQDTTGPEMTDITAPAAAEATGSTGAKVTYTEPTAEDAVSGVVQVACSPASGSTFAIGTTQVSCSATDAAKNTTTKSFDVVVKDTTAPVVIVPRDIVEEATSSAGNAVSYEASASDIVDGPVTPTCSPVSGSTFAIETTSVSCSATDAAKNTASKGFSVTVQDTKGPVLPDLTDLAAEATSISGAVVDFDSPIGQDVVDGARTASCLPAAGTFKLGATTVTCTAADTRGNKSSKSFTVTVKDTKAPVFDEFTAPAATEASGSNGAVVTYSNPTAKDAVDASPTVTCTPLSKSTFGLGETTVECSATDGSGNKATTSFEVLVQDTTAPELQLPSDITVPGGTPVTFAVTATDAVDGEFAATCTPASGSDFAFGTTEVKCTATDKAGNIGKGSLFVTVQRKIVGFQNPIDNGRTANTFKGGQTIPLKFEVFENTTEISRLDIFKSFSVKSTGCDGSVPTDAVEITTTGNTALRYDDTAGHYIQNWKTPSDAKGKCYQVAVETLDGATRIATLKGM
jgi:hypothetical protein